MLILALRVLVAGSLTTFYSGVQGFQWDPFPEDGAILYSCSTGKVSMPWRFTTGKEEELYDIHWTFEGLFSTQLIGSFTHDQFMSNPQYSERVRHLDNGGLSLSDVTVHDTGNYTMEVNVQNVLGVLISYRRQLYLQVAEDLMLRDHSLQAKQEPIALWDSERGQWVIELICGAFTFAGQAPINVTWTTPTGETKSSTGYHDGNFFLTLPSPVRGGNYSCHIPQHLLSDVCGTDNRQVKADVHVDELTARLSLIEAEQKTLKKENLKLKEKLQNMTETHREDVANLKEYVKEEKDEVMQDIRRVEDVHVADNTSLMDSLQRLQQNAANRQMVGFTVHMKNSHVHGLRLHQVIRWDNVLFNAGGGYNPSSGVFTAALPGTYVFFLQVMRYAQVEIKVFLDIVKNGSLLARAHAGFSAYENGSTLTVTHLNQGDTIRVEISHGSMFVGLEYSTFSGFRVSPH